MLAALLVAFSVSAPATLTSAALPKAPIIDVETLAVASSATAPRFLPVADATTTDMREPDFAEKYFSFSLSANASPQAKDSFVMSMLVSYLGCIVCGPIWAPVLMTKDAEFSGDVITTALISYLLWVGISIVTSPLAIGLATAVIWPYANGMATLNAVDRDIRRRGLAGGPAQKPGATPTPGTPPPTGETPPPSYAY